MVPIEQTESGMLVFLNCGCSAWRMRAHPTGAAFLVQIIERACDAHAGELRELVFSLQRGELVSPFVREQVS
jgi:hypothetical protein